MRRPRTNREALRTQIATLLRRVAFSQTAVRICETEGDSRVERFLLQVLKAEMDNRDEVRRGRFLREAAFPVYKTLSGYDMTNVRMPPQLSMADLDLGAFIPEKRNLVLYGPVGTGKTHLSIALGVAACAAGYRVRFFSAAELVVRLSEAFTSGVLERFLASILKAHLLIIDEWGYVPVDRQGAQLLFRVVSDSYERRSLIITTNLEFSKWGTIFTDDQMAAAMIDRVVHHGHILVFEGESYRMKNSLMRQRVPGKIPTK